MFGSTASMNRSLARLLRSRSRGTNAYRRTGSRVQAGIERWHKMSRVGLAVAGFVFGFLCAAGNAMADDQQDIQDAINALTGPGTVEVAPGRYQIEGTLAIPFDGVVLRGAGADQTIFFRQTDGTTTPMVHARNVQGIRVSGIRFEGVTAAESNGQELGVQVEDVANFRIDRCYFTRTGFAGVRTNGSSYGVVDHCTFSDPYKSAVGTDGYGVAVYGIGSLEGLPFGSEQATFIEDSVFERCRHAVSSNKGARYVFRYNQVAQNQIAHAIDTHGMEFRSLVGTEWAEIYQNVVDTPNFDHYAVRLRGGAGVIWYNTFSQYRQAVELTQDTSEPTGPVYIWGNLLDPPTMPLVRARGTMGTPTFSLVPPDNYVPYPYPHPLVTD
jgi:Pectate lyase superfamily protein